MGTVRKTLLGAFLAVAVVASVASPTATAAANRPLPKEANSYLAYNGGVELVPQVDGTGIYYEYVTPRTRKHRTRRNTIIRFDAATGKSRTVLDWGRRAIHDFRVGGGRLIASVNLSSKTRGAISMSYDGSSRVVLAKAPRRTKLSPDEGINMRVECGTDFSPASISDNGDIVIVSETNSCHSYSANGRFLIFRADGTRHSVSIGRVSSDDGFFPGDPFNTQLMGDRLLLTGDGAYLIDLATGVTTSAWGSGLDHAVLSNDGSLWLSAFGESASSDPYKTNYWTALLHGTVPFDNPGAIASGTADGEERATRYLPLICGSNILVVRAVTADIDYVFNDGFGLISQGDRALRFGGLVEMNVFSPDRTFLRSLPPARMQHVTAAGCDVGGVTLVGLAKRGFVYKRVAF